MADDAIPMESVNVTADSLPQKRNARNTALEIGAAFGAPVAAIAGGPVGLAVGAAYGLVSYLHAKSKLAQETEYQKRISLTTDVQEKDIVRLRALHADNPEMQATLDSLEDKRKLGWELTLRGDPNGAKVLDQVEAGLTGQHNAGEQQRWAKETEHRAFIVDATKSLRGEYQAVQQQQDAMREQTGRLHDIADSGVDLNTPFMKAQIAEIMTAGVGGFYKEDSTGLDALGQGIGGFTGKGIQAAQGIVEGLSTWVKSDASRITPELVHRLALNISKYSDQTAQARGGRIDQNATALHAAATAEGALPEGVTVHGMVTGEHPIELTQVQKPQYREPVTSAPSPELTTARALGASVSPVATARAMRQRMTGNANADFVQRGQQLQQQQEAGVLRPTN